MERNNVRPMGNRGNGQRGSASQQEAPEINPFDLPKEKCAVCGGGVFKQRISVRVLSPLDPRNPTGKSHRSLVPAVICDNPACQAEFDMQGE